LRAYARNAGVAAVFVECNMWDCGWLAMFLNLALQNSEENVFGHQPGIKSRHVSNFSVGGVGCMLLIDGCAPIQMSFSVIVSCCVFVQGRA